MTSAAPRSGWPEHWQDRERAPRRQPLSRERIVEAALRIVDTEGMDALSMRRVGQELGTGAASLYAHVGSKEELVELVLDLAYADIELEEADPARWEEQIKGLLRRSREALLSHRDLAKAAVVANVPTTPHAMDIAEAMLAVLRAADSTSRPPPTGSTCWACTPPRPPSRRPPGAGATPRSSPSGSTSTSRPSRPSAIR